MNYVSLMRNIAGRVKKTIQYRVAVPGLPRAVSAVRERKQSLDAWMGLFGRLSRDGLLAAEPKALLANHRFFSPSSALHHYAREIVASAAQPLGALAMSLSGDNAPAVAADAVRLIVMWKTTLQCRDSHAEGGYYAAAEAAMDAQWASLIEPYIRPFDLSKTLELAPGHGRNSAKLALLASELHLVDVNRNCIEACRKRFGTESNGCRFHYYVNDGMSLSFIASDSITFVYSFDSMVHFDKYVVREYLREFDRILVPGGAGFVHHSNLGAIKPDSDWASNHGNRSDMSAQLFRTYCDELSLQVLQQKLHGLAEGRGQDGLDCVTVFRKRG